MKYYINGTSILTATFLTPSGTYSLNSANYSVRVTSNLGERIYTLTSNSGYVTQPTTSTNGAIVAKLNLDGSMKGLVTLELLAGSGSDKKVIGVCNWTILVSFGDYSSEQSTTVSSI